MHHNHDIPHSTNDSAVNTKVVVPNPHSTIPSSTNPHSTKHNASNKNAQKVKSSTGSQRLNQPIVTHLGHTVKPPERSFMGAFLNSNYLLFLGICRGSYIYPGMIQTLVVTIK